MSKTKNQHYVPQFYLRNFSVNGRSVNFFTVARNKIVIGDSIRNQCSENYFYGKKYPLEKAFGEIETYSGTLLKKIITINYIPKVKSQDHSILQLFIVTLFSRTKYKLEEQNELVDKTTKSILELHPRVEKSLLNKVQIELDFPLHYPILASLKRYHLIQDLSIHLFINNTNIDFITSDQPVIYYNKWTEDIKYYGAVGIATKGLLIFLPLSPKKMLLLYDNSIYKVGNKKDSITVLQDSSELRNINLLQWLKCHDKIYFYNEEDQIKIRNEANFSIQSRQQSKIIFLEKSNIDGSKIIGAQVPKLKTKLVVKSIKIKKQAKTYSESEKIFAIRNPKLLALVDEFSEQIRLKKFSASEWNKFLEEKCLLN